MVRFPEATARLFRRVFVCRKCKTKAKAEVGKILSKQIACKKCGRRSFRVIKSKKAQK